MYSLSVVRTSPIIEEVLSLFSEWGWLSGPRHLLILVKYYDQGEDEELGSKRWWISDERGVLCKKVRKFEYDSYNICKVTLEESVLKIKPLLRVGCQIFCLPFRTPSLLIIFYSGTYSTQHTFESVIFIQTVLYNLMKQKIKNDNFCSFVAVI